MRSSRKPSQPTMDQAVMLDLDMGDAAIPAHNEITTDPSSVYPLVASLQPTRISLCACRPRRPWTGQVTNQHKG